MKNLFAFLRSPVFSPAGFFVRGILLLAALGILFVLGFQDYTCVICGTSPTGDTGDQSALLMGAIYVLLYLTTVFFAPVLILGGFFFWFGLYFFRNFSIKGARPPLRHAKWSLSPILGFAT